MPFSLLFLVRTRCGEFWSRHGKESEKRAFRDAAGTPDVCGHRFDFIAAVYAVFYLTLVYLLNSIPNFRDDISGGATTRGLTTWDLNHRAGPAPMERAPRPSFSQ